MSEASVANEKLFRKLLEIAMCDDTPCYMAVSLTQWLNGECKLMGYSGWVEAYHKMEDE